MSFDETGAPTTKPVMECAALSLITLEMRRLATLEGTVVDEDASPVPLAYVRLLTRVLIAGRQRWVAGPAATTDDRGRYRFTNLPPGRYVVVVPFAQNTVPVPASVSAIEGVSDEQLARLDAQAVQRGAQPTRRVTRLLVQGNTGLVAGRHALPPPTDDGHPQAYPTMFYPGVRSVSQAEPVDLDSGLDRSGVDVTISPVPAARISGHVVAASSVYGGMVLRLVPAGLEELADGSEAATAMVLPDGSFTFLNVPSGSYTLTAPGSTSELQVRLPATQGGRRPVTLPDTPGIGRYGSGASGGLVSIAPDVMYHALTPQTLADKHAGWVRIPLDVGGADIDNLTVPLTPSGSVRVQIVYEGLQAAVPSGSIELTPADGNPMSGVHTVYVDGNGVRNRLSEWMEMPVVLPGEYALRTIGMGDVTIKSIEVNGVDRSRDPLVVAGGQDARVVLTLTANVIRLSGFISGDRGEHVPRASAIAFPTDKQLWSNYGFTPTWIRVSAGSSDGAFQLSNLRAGDYYLLGIDASRSSAWSDPAFLDAAVGRATRLSLKWADRRVTDAPLMVSK